MGERWSSTTNDFHKIYYYRLASPAWTSTRWLGRRLLKCPMDLWIYQELIYRLKPDLIVETGTLDGGSAYYFASLLDIIGHGEIVTIDINEVPDPPNHARITYLTGSSTRDDVVRQVRDRCQNKPTVLVILDSDHTEAHVRRELELYSPLVTPGSYLVVEDTNVNGHPILPEFGPGPMEAVRHFLKTTDEFEVDRDLERHLISFNPSGWLKRRDGTAAQTADQDWERRREARRAETRLKRRLDLGEQLPEA